MARKSKRQFILLGSECGDISQAVSNEGDVYSSEAAAKKASSGFAREFKESNGDCQAVFVCEVVAVGKSIGLSWDK